jgi:AcrR family transcriptional regulator
MQAEAPPLFDRESPDVARLLRAAHHLLFTYGYQAFTMDELAHELGVSKKTLYVSFRSKDAIVERIIARLGEVLTENLEAVVNDENLTFTEKLGRVVAIITAMLARISPNTLRELQRLAPHLYDQIEAIRGKTIPLVFGRLIRDGIAEGKVRRDVDPAFATEFWLQAIRGLVNPATLERTKLSLPQTLQKGLNLFFAGLLTPAGRKDYETNS